MTDEMCVMDSGSNILKFVTQEDNKYCLQAKERMYVFCKEEKDNLRHFIQNCKIVKEMVHQFRKECTGKVKQDTEGY